MDFDVYETLPTNNVATHMTAGAVAGIMEHCVMYPLDSVKTRMQNLSPSENPVNRGVGETLFRMVKYEGVLRPVRGMSAVVFGAGPAHALYFSSYEHLKSIFLQKPINHNFAYGIAGCVATLLHDGVMNPAEVVKQRLQMYNSPYSSVLDCIKTIYKTEGINAFYRSYTTQLTMNIPFQSIHFMAYEFVQGITNPEKHYNPPAHMISGAFAGAVAAAITTPLDVCKTLLNTQPQRVRGLGLAHAIRTVYKLGGAFGYFRGMQARVLYQMPSTAICWSMYEFFKYILSNRSDSGNMPDPAGGVIQGLPLRLVVADPPVSAGGPESETKAVSFSNSASLPASHVWNSTTCTNRDSHVVGGTSIYGGLAFNTAHNTENNVGSSNQSLIDLSHS